MFLGVLVVGVVTTGIIVDPAAVEDHSTSVPGQVKAILNAHMVAPPHRITAKTSPGPLPKTPQKTPTSVVPKSRKVSPAATVDEAIYQGKLALRDRAYVTAVERFYQALKMAPKRQKIHYLYARALMRTKRVKEAIAVLKNALKSWPKYIGAAHLLARAYEAAGEPEAAKDAFEYYLKLEGIEDHHKDDLVTEGLRLLKAGDAHAAAGWFRRAAAGAPKDMRARYLWGKALFLAGDHSESAKIAESVLTASPDDLNAIYLAGRGYLAQGAKEQAKNHFERYLKLAPRGRKAKRVRKILKTLE